MVCDCLYPFSIKLIWWGKIKVHIPLNEKSEKQQLHDVISIVQSTVIVFHYMFHLIFGLGGMHFNLSSIFKIVIITHYLKFVYWRDIQITDHLIRNWIYFQNILR